MVALSIDSKGVRPVVILDRFSYAYPGATKYTLQDVSIRIAPGECHLLVGSTGSGKTTLLMAIKGLLPPGQQSGTINLIPRSEETTLPGSPGYNQQNPKTQLLCAHLGPDIAFGLENHCVDPAAMKSQVEKVLDVVGLNRPLHLPVDSLSMGQQYRACLAGQLVMHPHLVMMDEPVAQLDSAGRAKMLDLIVHLKESGRAVLISEHKAEILRPVVDYCWRLDSEGRLAAESVAVPAVSEKRKDEEISSNYKAAQVDKAKSSAVVCVRRLKFSNQYGELDLGTLDFRVEKGECIALCGPNGSGKTTLIRAIAGLVQPDAGTVEVLGGVPRLNELRGRLSVLFQDPGKQLFEATVFDEVAFAARRLIAQGGNEEQVSGRVTGLLEGLGINHLADFSPHLLSYGQKHLVSLAAVLAGKPEILLLDDPFSGLDSDRAARLMALVARESFENGTTVIWTSHDSSDLEAWADRHIEIFPGARQGTGGQGQSVPSELDNFRLPPSRKFQLPTGGMLCLCMTLSTLAFAARTTEILLGLTVINLFLLLLFGQNPAEMLKKSALLLFWQALLIILLYSIRFGFMEGALPGGRVAWQLFLAFWPGMIFMSANSQPKIVRTLAKVLPQRAAFVSATCLRFLPMLLSEIQEIREVQILRGARLLFTDLKSPRAWPDWLFCLMIPTLIKTLSMAGEIATAATAREYGIYAKRTAWPGD